MFLDSFLSAFAQDWRTPFLSAIALKNGRAALKRHLATTSAVGPETLPYDARVLDYIDARRRSGGKAALVTASDRNFAEAIATHLGVFDEVHVSDGALNLKGEQKARFLGDRFGMKRFAYMGDARSRFAGLGACGKTITVNAPAALRRQAEAVSKGMVEHP